MYISCVAGREKERERERGNSLFRASSSHAYDAHLSFFRPMFQINCCSFRKISKAERGQSYNASKISMTAYGATSLTQRDLAIWDRFN